MSAKKPVFDLNQARNELTGIINNFISLVGSDELMSRVKALVPVFHLLRKFGTNIIPDESSARDRILIYFQKYPLTVIASDELMVVAGITDYQRRMRELRVQFGWPILGGSTHGKLDDSVALNYVLSKLNLLDQKILLGVIYSISSRVHSSEEVIIIKKKLEKRQIDADKEHLEKAISTLESCAEANSQL